MKKDLHELKERTGKVEVDLKTMEMMHNCQSKVYEREKLHDKQKIGDLERQVNTATSIIQTMQKEVNRLSQNEEHMKFLASKVQALEDQMKQGPQYEVDNAKLILGQLAYDIPTILYEKVHLSLPKKGYCASFDEIDQDMDTTKSEPQDRYEKIKKVVLFDSSDKSTLLQLKALRKVPAHPKLSDSVKDLQKALGLLKANKIVWGSNAVRITKLIEKYHLIRKL